MAQGRKRKKRSEGAFTNHDKLVLFLMKMGELTSRTYYKRVNWHVVPSVQPISINEVDEELLAAFVLTFRHFHAQESPTRISHIRSILVAVAKTTGDQGTLDGIARIEEDFEKAPRLQIRPYDLKGQWLPEITEDEMFDLYFNCHYFHTDFRGARFFFQMPPEARVLNRKAFELSLFRHVRRLHSYVPLATKFLNSPALPKGGFNLSPPGAGTVTITIPVDPPWSANAQPRDSTGGV